MNKKPGSYMTVSIKSHINTLKLPEASTQKGWPNLPKDLMLEILKFIPDLSTLKNVHEVCRSWSQMPLVNKNVHIDLSSPYFVGGGFGAWKKVKEPITDATLAMLKRLSPRSISLNLNSNGYITSAGMSILKELPLTWLDVRGSRVGREELFPLITQSNLSTVLGAIFIKVNYKLSEGHQLFIRGFYDHIPHYYDRSEPNYDELSWDKGIPMTKIDSSMWGYVRRCYGSQVTGWADKSLTFKVLLDDLVWETGKDHHIESRSNELESRYNKIYTYAPEFQHTIIRVNKVLTQGHALYVRGKGDGIGWGKGEERLMEEVTPGVWEARFEYPIEQYKILHDNAEWETGSNHTATPGQINLVTPHFQSLS